MPPKAAVSWPLASFLLQNSRYVVFWTALLAKLRDVGGMAHDKSWNYHPALPIQVSPLFQWPLRPIAILRWFWDSWFLISEKLLIVGIALLSWHYLQPQVTPEFSLSWVLPMWIRNLALMTLVAGGLHLWFYTFSGQEDALRYDPRDISRGRVFTFNRQLWDNMFWTLASGVTVWTLYEALMLWAFATGWLIPLAFTENPVWFIALFFLVPVWESFYFYWIHRWLHWKPLYKLAHHLHHRNSNVGPWSGLSMHPVEHVIYLGSVMIHWVIASHPVHILYHLQFYALSAATTHSGYEGVFIRNKKRLAMGTFHHQMHHRYFECNYGSLEIPWDKFFGSFHDGTEAGRVAMQERRKRLAVKLGE